MELYSTIYGTVYFKGVRDTGNAVLIDVTTFCNTEVFFYPDGKFNTYYSDSEMTLFPSKDVRTWEGFVPPCKFKDGDIVATTPGNWIGITTGGENNCFMPVYCVIKSDGKFEAYFDKEGFWAFDRLATEEEKQKLFDAIKANGYKWNAETKTLEKLIEPKFKVGDKIKSKENHNYIYTITGVREKENKYECGVPFVLRFSEQDNWELVSKKSNITTLKPFDVCSMEWIKIERDRDGFATKECLDKMTRALPFCLLEQFNEHGVDHFYVVITLNNVDRWMGEITANTHCTHYLPIPKLGV